MNQGNNNSPGNNPPTDGDRGFDALWVALQAQGNRIQEIHNILVNISLRLDGQRVPPAVNHAKHQPIDKHAQGYQPQANPPAYRISNDSNEDGQVPPHQQNDSSVGKEARLQPSPPSSLGDSDSYLSETRFDQFPLSPLSLKGIKDVGYEKMTLVQEATFPVILKGKDVLAKAKTGTGKTVAFLLPSIEIVLRSPPVTRDQNRPPILVLVVCPTRELANQAAAEANNLLKYHPTIGRTGRKGKEGQGILVLAPWEEFFLSRIKDLPMTKADAPLVDPETKTKVEHALSHLEMKNKEAAYQAWLGYYSSNKTVGRDKCRVVELANEFSRSMGLDNPPAIPKLAIGKIGLRNIPGLRSK